MKNLIFIICIVATICSFGGCKTYSLENNDEYSITDDEKTFIRERALKLVRSRTYCIYNTVTEEYAEDNYYHFVILACNGEEFKIKVDLSEKDENGNYLMYSE